MLTGVLLFTGIVHWIENVDYTNAWNMPSLDNGSPLCPSSSDYLSHPNRNGFDFDGCRTTIKYHDALYFLMVTVSTVGYGDMSPQTIPGRILIICMICVFLLQIPVITNKLAEAFSQFSFYERAIYRPKRGDNGGHVIICGSANTRPIMEFMQELFHPDHRNPQLQVIILTRGPPSRAILRLLNSVHYRARTTYLDGDVVSTKDLARAAADTAEHFFIVADPMASNAEREDSHNTLRALAIKQFVYSHGGKKATISIQMLRHESRGTYFDSVKVADYARADREKDDAAAGAMLQDQVICLDEIKLSLMAQGAGICTMISNLCTSMTIEKNQAGGHRWASEYLDGCDYEVYRIWLSPVFQGLQFAEVAEKVHSETGVLLFALELHAPRGEANSNLLTEEEIALRNSLPPRIVLNPHDFIIPSIVDYRVHVFVIAGDRADAIKVQHWGLPGFEHDDEGLSGGLRASLRVLKEKGSEAMNSFGHLPDFLSHHQEQGGKETSESVVNIKTRNSRVPSVYAAQKVKEDKDQSMQEMNEMLNRTNKTKKSQMNEGDIEETDLDVPVLGGLMKTTKKKLNKKKSFRQSMFARKKSIKDDKDLAFEKHLEKLRIEQELEVQKAQVQAKLLENDFDKKRKLANKSRLMSKLRKYAVNVGEQKADENEMIRNGVDPREAKVMKRRRKNLMGSALSESTWERLGADVSTLDAGHQVELSHVIIETVKHLDHKMHHHIIACGPLAKLWSFILPLRSKHVQVVQPIVVLSRSLPTEEEWTRYSRFPDIYLVRGSPLNISDLHAAGTNSASRAVLFGDMEANSSSTMDQPMEEGAMGDGANKFGRQMRDSSTILAYRALKVVNPRINVTVELISAENLRLLDESEMGSGTTMHTKDESDKPAEPETLFGSLASVLGITSDDTETESWLSPSFASGHAFLSTVTDTIFAQSYYNRHLIAIIQELVIGTPDILAETWNKVIGSEIGKLNDSHLYLVVVPKDCHNRSYSYVLYNLLQKGVLAMGLRRGVTIVDKSNKMFEMAGLSESNNQPYVYTNPSPSTIVRSTDLLYVLCHGAPHELGLDIALFDYESKKGKKELASSVISKLKGFGNLKKSAKKGKEDLRRRGSMLPHMQPDLDNLQSPETNAHQAADVGVPQSMINGKKSKRRFTVTQTDLIHTSPMIKLAKQLEQSEKHRKKLDVQMQNIKKDLFKEVNTLNVSMNTRMDQLTTSLEAVEKYMWRQNVLQGMRENSARKKRQQKIRSNSPPRIKPNSRTESPSPGGPGMSSPIRFERATLETGGLSTAERRKLEGVRNGITE